ncbi:TetR/AcrR family transcriptional regulator [Limosilactobacillus fermentum]|uniref:TetR/AcrR family transcriptional regulator n=1 Tax=Limosilactobacillus fermentum TaxID=1613 RepID=UPI000A90DBE7
MLDIRIQNTKSRIQNGLLELLKQKPLNDITTKDIIESAEASRKTFYTYYKDKHDLLMEIEGAIITDLQEALKEDRKCLTQHSSFLDKEEIFRLSQESFAHTVQVCSDYREVSRILLSPNGDINLLTRITYSEFMHRGKLLFYFNSQHPSTNVHPSPIPVDYLFEIYTGTLTNIIVHWVRSDDRISTSALREIMGYAQTHSPVELIYLTNFDEQADPDQPSTTSTPNRKKSGQSPKPLLKHMGFGCWPLFFCLSFATTTKG